MITDNYIAIEYRWLNNKKWLFSQEKFLLQCIYCLHVQMTLPVREKPEDNLSMVIGVEYDLESESHTRGCPQEVKP
jgi:hypothetical protein